MVDGSCRHFPTCGTAICDAALFWCHGIVHCAMGLFQEINYTFVIRFDHLDKIKPIAYLERKMIKHVIA